MVLFDAVDRALGIDSTDIPNNVEKVVYARRHPNGRSCLSFSNCGTRWHAPTRCDMKYFLRTHGALGGPPWKALASGKDSDLISEDYEPYDTRINYVQDAKAAHDVWVWVEPRLTRLGYFGTPPKSSTTEVEAVV
jgi:hypothetical protein